MPSLIEDRKFAPVLLGRVLILGLGVSGRACVEYLAHTPAARVSGLCVYGGVSNESVLAWAEEMSAKFDNIEFVFDTEVVEGHFDLCIASPGISEFSDFYKSAESASGEIISEIEFAWRESASSSKWVAITGTNGKTTTTSLAASIFSRAGFDAKAVGNIGDVAIEAVARDLQRCNKADASFGQTVYVVEASSYQLASTSLFAPDVAVVLGIMPDHLSWHRSHENYAAAKWKILANMASVPGAVAILDAVNDEVRAKVRDLKAMDESSRGFDYVPLGTARGIDSDMRVACGAKNAAFVDGEGVLCVAFKGAQHCLSETDKLKLKGAHNHLNALAAASAAVVLGIPDAEITSSLEAFEPLEHRIEPAGSAGGVAFFNDSKATNVDATLVALSAFLPKKPIVMFGGRDKGTSLDDLVCACRRNVKAAICFGEAKDRFFEALCAIDDPTFVLDKTNTFDEAFACACRLADEGDIVLLSPACASFDEFSCFEERGEHFKGLVGNLSAGLNA